MVCVPCFIIPVLLYIWHKFLQPILLRYWNPWEKKDAQGNVIKPEFPFQCKGGVCPYPGAKAKIKIEQEIPEDVPTEGCTETLNEAQSQGITIEGHQSKKQN